MITNSCYILAYGSLMDKDSWKSTVGETFYTPPIVSIKGMRRDVMSTGRNSPKFRKFWVVDMEPNVQFGEVAPVFKPMYFNAVVDRKEELVAPALICNSDDLKKIQAREGGYEMVDVSDLIELKSGYISKDLPIYMFVAKSFLSLETLDPEAKMPEQYLEMCQKASVKISDLVAKNFNRHLEILDIPVMKGIKLGDNITY